MVRNAQVDSLAKETLVHQINYHTNLEYHPEFWFIYSHAHEENIMSNYLK